MVVDDRVVNGLKEVGLGGELECPEHVQSDQRRTGSHALDADVAGGRIRLGTEAVDVVDHDALAGDRVGIEECLVAAGELAGPVAAEVLIVASDRGIEHRLAVRPDEVHVGGVHAVGDPGDLHAGARDAERSRGQGTALVRVGLREREPLGSELHLTVGAAGPRDHVGRQRRADVRCRGGGGGGARRTVDHHVGHHLGNRRVGLQPLHLAVRDRGGERIDHAVVLDAFRLYRAQLAHHRRLVECRVRTGEPVLHDDDHRTVDALRQLRGHGRSEWRGRIQWLGRCSKRWQRGADQ